MQKRSYFWLAAATGLWAVLILASLLLPRSFALTTLSDVVQCILLFSGAAAFVPLALRSRGRIRLFWALISLGISFWLLYQLLWTTFEVLLRRDVPDLFSGDIILFLHIVPLMAAVALRPHVPRDEYAARVGGLDFALLMVWWLYLYVLMVMPWQYAVLDPRAYNRHLNAVYVAEEIAFLIGLIACWATSKGHWKTLYSSFFGMSVCYAASSTVMNWAIGHKLYYSGSRYDIPYVSAIAGLTWIGVLTKAETPSPDAREGSTLYGVWIARCSMISVFSLPLFAAWALADKNIPPRVAHFRLAVTLIAAFLMSVMILVRQRRLDRELTQLLQQSRQSFESLKHLQAQILQSEKLASIGQLVGGAAHELNNPITAMLGYSEMLLSTALSPEQRPLAAKIGQHVRRTRALVASLISFARQSPAPKGPIDLNTLARTAIKLSQPQCEALEVSVITHFDPALPKVFGDSNQLLQVCLQLLVNSLQVLSEHAGRLLTVRTERQADVCVLQIATEPISLESSEASIDEEGALGMSACQGIMQEHRGQISQELLANGILRLRVELPITQSAPARSKESTVPVLWQSQPYA